MTDRKPSSPAQDLANKSGYPFQMAVAEAVRLGSVGWEIIDCEVPWEGGFADIAIRATQEKMIAVIECKRLEASNLVFLVPESATPHQNRMRLEEFNCEECKRPTGRHDHVPVFACAELTMAEGSYEAEYCVSPKKKGGLNSLEAVCRELLDAGRDIGRRWAESMGEVGILPVVVTNATLSVCRFSPDAVPLDTGKIGISDVEKVGVARFRKSFDVRSATSKIGKMHLYRPSLRVDTDRTVFVVNAGNLVSFLSRFRALQYAR